MEHELQDIERINRWLASGRLNNEEGKYRHIEVRTTPMPLDLSAGAALVNSELFIRKMMDYGHQHAHCLWAPSAVPRTAQSAGLIPVGCAQVGLVQRNPTQANISKARRTALINTAICSTIAQQAKPDKFSAPAIHLSLRTDGGLTAAGGTAGHS